MKEAGSWRSPLFPSGPWVGFYAYEKYAQRLLMDLHLSFRARRIEGEGADGLDTFVISGVYDAQKLKCSWQKEEEREDARERRLFGFR